MNETIDVIAKVRAALGRGERLKLPPVPPPFDEPITRLVHSDVGLAELFVQTAKKNNVLAEITGPDALSQKLIGFLQEYKAKRIALPVSPLLEKLGVAKTLQSSGFEVRRWDQLTLDELYDFDAGISDVYAAVAEIGGLVVQASPQHGRALSLVPAIHVAIIEPKNLLADLVDLFEKMKPAPPATATSIITGPSKTSDIEMNLVVGVHGPVVVKVFVLQ